jgi:hypothetical protein
MAVDGWYPTFLGPGATTHELKRAGVPVAKVWPADDAYGRPLHLGQERWCVWAGHPRSETFATLVEAKRWCEQAIA